MEAAEYRELLDIAMAPEMKGLTYYRSMRNRYNEIISQKKDHIPEKPPEMYMAAESSEARRAVMSVFRSMKRGMGYRG